MKIIIISGTPGTGKTTVSNKACEMINARVISLNELSIKKNFILEYDEERETSIVNFNLLLPHVLNLIESFRKEGLEFLIIEGHFSDIIPNKFIDFIFILRRNPDELINRLKKRGYKNSKIMENVQSEILGNCVNYMIEKKIKIPILEIDTSNSTSEHITEIMVKIIKNEINHEEYIIGKIDWLEDLNKNDRIMEFFK